MLTALLKDLGYLEDTEEEFYDKCIEKTKEQEHEIDDKKD